MDDTARRTIELTSADKGHAKLIKDLFDLLIEAEAFEFHDFKNQHYAAPKVTLAGKLEKLRQNVIGGRYDNRE